MDWAWVHSLWARVRVPTLKRHPLRCLLPADDPLCHATWVCNQQGAAERLQESVASSVFMLAAVSAPTSADADNILRTIQAGPHPHLESRC